MIKVVNSIIQSLFLLKMIENKDFSNINTTFEINHIYENILEDFSSIEQCKNPQDQHNENFGTLVVAKPRNKRSFRIVAIIVGSIIVLAVILIIILAILATTSN